MNNHRQNRSGLARTGRVLFLVGILIVVSFAFLKYHKKIEFSFMHFKKALTGNSSEGEVRCFISTNIEGRHYLRLKIAIPCENRNQRLEVTRNLPRFKNELLMEMSDPRMKQAIERRDFETLRHRLVKILNSFTEQRVTNIYFEGFSYN